MMNDKLNSHVRTSEEGYFVYPGILWGAASSGYCHEAYYFSQGYDFLSSGRGGAAC